MIKNMKMKIIMIMKIINISNVMKSKMNNMNNDTICALATGGGISAIALIRISGKETINIVNKIFSKDLSKKETHNKEKRALSINSIP